MSRADVLAELALVDDCLATAADEPVHQDCMAKLRAIAAAVASWCVVEGGHNWTHRVASSGERVSADHCKGCGQRRDVANV